MSTPQVIVQNVLEKVSTNASSINTEDARRLSESLEAQDERSASIISAVEALAAMNLNMENTSKGDVAEKQHVSTLTIVKDLDAAVDNNPTDITPEILKTTQNIVSKMHKIVGQTSAPHPHLEGKLQEEYARIVPKVEQGIVTKAEADHLHSLESRAHGHTEKGGLAATAQSVAAKRERAESLSSNKVKLHEEAAEIKSKVDHGTVTKDDANYLHSLEARANGMTEKGGVAATAQSVADKENNLEKDSAAIEPKIKEGIVTKEDANRLHSLENRAHGTTEKGSIAATAQSVADKEANFKKDVAEIEPKIKDGTVTKDEANHLHSLEIRAHGAAEKGGPAAQAQSVVDKRERAGSISNAA